MANMQLKLVQLLRYDAQHVTQDWLLMVAKLQLLAGHFPNFA